MKLPQTSGRGTGTPSQREQDVQKENLRLQSENLELRFQLEQNVKDVPRLRVRGTFTHFSFQQFTQCRDLLLLFTFPCFSESSVRPERDERRSEEGSRGAGEETGPYSWSSCLRFLSRLILLCTLSLSPHLCLVRKKKNKLKKQILTPPGRPEWENGAGAGENSGPDEEGGGAAAAGEREPEENHRGRQSRPSGRPGERERRAQG